jgi:hypothetical protein
MPAKTTTKKMITTNPDEEILETPVEPVEAPESDTKMLLEQINALRAELAAMKASSPRAETKTEEDKYNPNRLVILRNMYNGFNLSLRMDDHGGFRSMTKFGETMRIRLSEAENIVRLNRGFAAKGYYMFDDPEVSEYLGIDDISKKAVTVNFIQSLSEATPEAIANAYTNANEHFREIIMETFVNGHVKGEKTGFRDQAKIEALSKASGEDINLRIRAVQETRPQ